MFGFPTKRPVVEPEAILQAFDKSQAMIAFEPDGTVIQANQNFLTLLGYSESEIVGKHHSMFVAADEVQSVAYGEFWRTLAAGQFKASEFCRWAKSGQPVWIQASYNPVFNKAGRVVRVVKIASDVTATKNSAADALGQLKAIGKVQAIIEFSLDGIIIEANANFCATLGYERAEIIGRHHRIFVEAKYASSQEYQLFWDRLRAGEFQAAEFNRVGKGRKEVWIQASYNPIFDATGKPFKVVKYATDITGRKKAISITGHALALLAQGDLRATIDNPFEGELDGIRVALNQTTGKFADIIAGLRATSSSLRAATGEILSGSNDLADRTSKQAAAIEETSAAMEQLALTVVENSKRSEVAHTTSKAVAGSAADAGDVMHRANDAMDRIATSSSKISNIIGMIDDIAFQTNLLALNASVEAARAGDAGKGFAVVAVEVRRLAQSAAAASAEVKVLIEQSAAEVSNGAKLVADASSRVLDVLSGIRESSALVADISRATHDQAAAIEQVTVAIRDMDEMTQHNAALVEETNAAIEQTETQASELDAVVDIFALPSLGKGEILHSRPKAAVGRIRSTAIEQPTMLKAVGQDWNEF